MKFATQVLLLVCASVTFVQAEKQTAVWQDLLVHDCNKGLHIFPSSPTGGSVDGTALMTALDFGLKEVKKRIKYQATVEPCIMVQKVRHSMKLKLLRE